MTAAPAIHHDGKGRCFYRPSSDSVHMTPSSAFNSAEGYYSTLLHELVHSTGHASRLNRSGVNGTGPVKFGSEDYSREELVAELGAAFLCAETGISQPVIENQAAYIRGWLNALQDDPKAIVWAAGKAARAADYIANRKHEAESEETPATTAETPAPEPVAPVIVPAPSTASEIQLQLFA
jgi:antirestriction protein ArdC